MKKILVVVIAIFMTGSFLHAQKKAGTIYSEHEYIDITRELNEAFANGDVDKFISFFADSVFTVSNDNEGMLMASSSFKGDVEWWQANFDNLKVVEDKPAYPDALDFKDGLDWVQDWTRMQGRHKETGINLDLRTHSYYGFDEDGKVVLVIRYFDDDIFEKIANAKSKRENGRVYIDHPYITKTRKGNNAWVDRDVEKWASFYHEKASFAFAWDEFGKTRTLEDLKKILKSMADSGSKIHNEEVGYPDCIYYAKSDTYVVYSWWKDTFKKDGKPYSYSYMLSQTYNKDGKIVREVVYASSNHWEGM